MGSINSIASCGIQKRYINDQFEILTYLTLKAQVEKRRLVYGVLIDLKRCIFYKLIHDPVSRTRQFHIEAITYDGHTYLVTNGTARVLFAFFTFIQNAITRLL